MNAIVRALVGASAVSVAVAATGFVVAGASEGPHTDAPLGPGPVTVTVGIEHSAFSLDELTVRQGTEVRFVVDNRDPILHELIVGPPAVHERHENGTEAAHAPRPGEVTVDPLSLAATNYIFDTAGSFEFACHLPGHLAYGMTGTITVVPD